MSPCYRILLLGMAGVSLSAPVHAIECTPLKPNTPVDRVVENEFQGGANILFRTLGSGELQNRYQKVQNDVLFKYPNADELHIWKSYIYMLCTFLDTSELDDNEKFVKFQWLVDKWRQEPSAQSEGGATKQVTEVKVALESENLNDRRLAILDALGSGDADLQYLALSKTLERAGTLAISARWEYASGRHEEKTAFLTIQEFDAASGVVNGTLGGSDISNYHRGEFVGKLSGLNFSGSNDRCTLNVTLKPDYRMEGYLKCGIYGGPAVIPLR